ncbi:MAG: efflux transporter outer membrane subunit [Sandaracinaceae bacterium]
MRARSWAPLASLVAAMGGCSPHHTVAHPAAPVDVPSSYAATAGDEAVADQEAEPERWWVAFGDPELVHLVDEALEHNFQLGAAWARLEQAESGVMAASSGYWPQISAQLDVARRRQVVVFGALGTQAFEVNSFGVSVPVSYEVDLWNRIGHSVSAGALDVVASRDDVEALAMTLVANVVEAWLNVVHQRALHALLTEQLATNEIFEELVELRLRHGLGSALDVYQQRQQVQAARAQLAQISGAEAVARQQLAILVGQAPSAFASGQIGELPEPTTLPPLPPLPSTGIPSDLLLRRPDVRAARRRVAAQDHRVGAAIADQFPQLRFNASVGLSNPSIEGLLSSFVWSLASSLLAPVLDGGRRAAEVRRNEAALRERVQTFGQTLLTALFEVESSLTQERQLAAQIASLEDQLSAANATLFESRRRYSEGLSDYLPVLTALSAVQRTEQSILAARRQLLSQRVQLARALGGSWSSELEAPRLPEPEERAEDDDER